MDSGFGLTVFQHRVWVWELHFPLMRAVARMEALLTSLGSSRFKKVFSEMPPVYVAETCDEDEVGDEILTPSGALPRSVQFSSCPRV